MHCLCEGIIIQLNNIEARKVTEWTDEMFEARVSLLCLLYFINLGQAARFIRTACLGDLGVDWRIVSKRIVEKLKSRN